MTHILPVMRVMQSERRTFLATLAAAGLGAVAGCYSNDKPAPGSNSSPESAAARRGLEWLLRQQAQDGAWHSETYGALKQGAALTALVIYTIGHLPEKLRASAQAAAARGFEYLQPGLTKLGYVAAPDGSLDYPTYSTALLVTAARSYDYGLKPELAQKLADWVAGGQLHESREFTKDSPHYGGWDLMGASQVLGLTSDTNVSATCFALEALLHGKSDEIKRTIARAEGWARGCQDLQGDGGFWFSPDPESINHKAGFQKQAPERPRTYGSSTCDGLRCLLYSGVSATDDAAQAALAWLNRHTEVKHVPGFDDGAEINSWGMGLRFYYYQSLAKLLPYFEKEAAAKRQAAIEEQVVGLQQKDGRWQNESSRMREDDPIIATCLALVALGAGGEADN